jgi:hypothetical protein
MRNERDGLLLNQAGARFGLQGVLLCQILSAIGGRFDQAFILQQGLGGMSFQLFLVWGWGPDRSMRQCGCCGYWKDAP